MTTTLMRPIDSRPRSLRPATCETDLPDAVALHSPAEPHVAGSLALAHEATTDGPNPKTRYSFRPYMTSQAPTYDLVLLLDPQAEPDARAKIVDDARKAIAAKGEVVNDADWGDRALTYPIDRKKDAEYRLLQFKASTPELLSELDRTLRITDGVLRFRIVKLKPGTPAAPDLRSGAHAPVRTSAETAPAPAAQTAAPTESDAPASPPEPPAEEPAEEPAAQAQAAPTPLAEPA